MKKTAVEWLIDEIIKLTGVNIADDEPIIEKAKEMEKEQIIDAYTSCWENDGGNGYHKEQEAEQYYNETFKLE